MPRLCARLRTSTPVARAAVIRTRRGRTPTPALTAATRARSSGAGSPALSREPFALHWSETRTHRPTLPLRLESSAGATQRHQRENPGESALAPASRSWTRGERHGRLSAERRSNALHVGPNTLRPNDCSNSRPNPHSSSHMPDRDCASPLSPEFANELRRPLTGRGPPKFAANWRSIETGDALLLCPRSLIRGTSCAVLGCAAIARSACWSHLPDSNRRPTHYECVALPTELRWRTAFASA
jgi:hypothetical protein